MNIDLLNIEEHPSKSITDKIRNKSGVINLTVGEPSYDPPETIYEELQKISLHEKAAYNRYTDSRGLPELRQQISEYYNDLHQIKVDPDKNVLVTNGAAGGIWLTIFTLTNAGDEILMADPCYILYERITRVLGRIPVRVSTTAKSNFCINKEDLQIVITDKSKLLILNSPTNPTGSIYPASTLASLLEEAVKHNLMVMNDEVFDKVYFEGKHTSLLAFDTTFENTVVINSFSKRFGMTGWRVGWMIAKEEIIKQASKAHTFMNLSSPTIIQRAIYKSLNDPEVEKYVKQNIKAIQLKGQRFYNDIEQIPGFEFPCGFPKAGFYLFIQIDKLYQAIINLNKSDEGSKGEVVAHYMLENFDLAVVPGTGFGPGFDSFIRVSFVLSESELAQAAQRFKLVSDSVFHNQNNTQISF